MLQHLGRNLLGVEHWAAMGMLLVDCGIFAVHFINMATVTPPPQATFTQNMGHNAYT